MEALSEERAPTLPETPQNDSQEVGILLVRYRQGDRTESASVESHRERRSYSGQWAVMLVNAQQETRDRANIIATNFV